MGVPRVLTSGEESSDVVGKDKLDTKVNVAETSESNENENLRKRLNESLSACNIIKNVTKTRLEMRKK